MKIKIVENPYVFSHDQVGARYLKKLKKFAGKWMIVDTEYLFADQFNTKNGNLRVIAQNVAEIKHDKRLGKIKDTWTGEYFSSKKKIPLEYLSSPERRKYLKKFAPTEYDDKKITLGYFPL